MLWFQKAINIKNSGINNSITNKKNFYAKGIHNRGNREYA